MAYELYLTDLQLNILKIALEKYQMELQQVAVRTPSYEARLRSLGDLLYDVNTKVRQ